MPAWKETRLNLGLIIVLFNFQSMSKTKLINKFRSDAETRNVSLKKWFGMRMYTRLSQFTA